MIKKWRNIQKGCTLELNFAIRPYVCTSLLRTRISQIPIAIFVHNNQQLDGSLEDKSWFAMRTEGERGDGGEPNGFPKETSWFRPKLKLFGPKFWALINNDGLTTTQ